MRAKRLSNKIKLKVVENVKHNFPELSTDSSINELILNAIEDTEYDAHLFRISTGAGKSERLVDVLSGLKREDKYLVVCDTNQNIDEQVKKLNDYFDKKTNPIGTPLDKSYVPSYFNYEHSCATSLKGKNVMCNKLTSKEGEDNAFKEKYPKGSYIPVSECEKCFFKQVDIEDDVACNYWNQADSFIDGRLFPNIYLTHFNTLYNEASELFKTAIPKKKRLKVPEDPNDINNDKYKTITRRCNPIKAIIVDENAIQYDKDDYQRCIVPTDAPDEKITAHKLLISVFKLAHKDLDLNLTVQEIRNLPVIYGEELKKLLDKVPTEFDAKKVLKEYKFGLAEKRKKSDTPYSDTTDVYLNVLKYLTKKKEPQHLYGMRISNGGFVQGQFKAIKNRFKKIKILYLDATMNMEIVSDAILQDKKVEEIAIDVKMSEHIKIHQLNGKTCSKTTLGVNDNVNRIIDHAKQFIVEKNLQNTKGGLITFQKMTIDGVEDENFQITAAKQLWGDNYQLVTQNQTRYFGNTRGYNGMQDCDYLIIIGDYNLPSHALESHHWNLYDKPANLTYRSEPHYNRMADGSCSQTDIKRYDDQKLQGIYEHFCIAELEQALGRGRLIHGTPKEILVYSSMPLGNNVEITSFIDPAPIFPRQVIDDEKLTEILKIGFLKDKREDIVLATSLTKGQYRHNKDEIVATLLAAGLVLKKVSYKNRDSKRINYDYFIKDESALMDNLKDLIQKDSIIEIFDPD